MPLTLSHRKAPLKTYGGNRRARFAVFQDPVSPTTTKKSGGVARKDKDVTPETSYGPFVNPGTGHPPRISPDLTNQGADSSDELSQTSRFLRISSHAFLPTGSNDTPTKFKRTNADNGILPKLQDKTTNMMVKPTLTRAQLLATPVTQAIRPQLPKTPPKKKPQSKIPLKHSPSPLRRRGKHSVAKIEQAPEIKNFPNILSPLRSKPNSKRLSGVTGNSTGLDTASVCAQVSRNRGMDEHKPGKNSTIVAVEDTNKNATVTIQSTGRLYPILVQPKLHQDTGLRANLRQPRCAINQGLMRGTKTKSRKYDETDSEDLRQDNTIRTRTKARSHTMQESGGHGENLSESHNPESSGDDGEATRASYGKNKHGMISDHPDYDGSHEGQGFKNSTRSLRKHKHIANRITHHDDSDQAFDGDVEMLTGDDNSDSDEVAATSMESVIPKLTYPEDEDTHESDTDEDYPPSFKEGTSGTNQATNDMGDSNDTSSESNDDGDNDDDNDDDMMDLEFKTKKRGPENSPNRPGAKRHLSVLSRTIPRSKDTHKITSLLHSPPEDPSKLSEDELCSTKYMITPVSIKDRNKTPLKPGNKKRMATPRGKGKGHKSPTDLMDID